MFIFSTPDLIQRTAKLNIWLNRPDHHFGPRFFLMYDAS